LRDAACEVSFLVIFEEMFEEWKAWKVIALREGYQAADG